MAFAVINLQGMLRCTMGAAPFPMMPHTAIGIDINMMTVATIMDVPEVPFFGSCTMWNILTAGVSSSCAPAVVPPFVPGAIGVTFANFPAAIQTDIGTCSIGGTLMFEQAGSLVELS